MSTNNDLQAIDDHDDNSFLLNKEMELSSPPNGLQDLNHILIDNEPDGLDELHPNSIVNKEQNLEYAFGNLATTNIDDFPYYELYASPQQTFSPLQAGFGDNVVLSDAQLVNDDDVDDGQLCSDYLSTSSFQVEVESIRNNTDAEVSGQIMDSSLQVDITEEQRMIDVPTENLLFSVEVNGLLNNEPLITDQHSPDKSLEVPKSPDPASRETSALPRDIHQQPHSSEVNTPADEKKNASLNISPQGEQYMHEASARNHHSQRGHRRRKRSVSKSPSRGKVAPSRHRRVHQERSRSRSPHQREYYKRSRSPRRRYAPSHRSPPSSYHSRYRSPKRRHWSPSHSRNNGIGKPGRNLFIAGFSFLTTERDLERKFSRFGRARDVLIVRDKRSGESRGFGFLTLDRDEEADAAIRALDKTEWNGRVILVEKSKPNS